VRRVALSAAIAAAAANTPPAQQLAEAEIARVTHSGPVSADEPDARHVESVLALNPRDPQNLVSAAVILGTTEGIAVYASRDAGRTWFRAKQSPGGKATFDGLDPAVAFDQEGTAYFLSIDSGAQIAVWKSNDGGMTWSRSSPVAGIGWDRPWIACAKSPSAGVPEQVFVAGKLPVTVFGEIARDIIAFSGSSDRGASFRFPRLLLPKPDADILNVVSDLAVDADDRVVLTLQLFPPSVIHDEFLAGRYRTIVSEDGGRTFSPPRSGPDFHVYGHAAEGKSLFGLGGARLAVDRTSGPHRGRLYLAWVDVIEGFYRVRAAWSANGGETWSEPTFVGSAPTADASTPAVAVDGKGRVGVVWYDRGSDESGGCYQLFFAASSDGGASFSAAQRLDETRTCPLGESGADPVTSEYRFKNGGDTQGIVGLPKGGFHLAWIRSGGREMQLWSTTIELR
jgi:hypothetical protein